MSPKFLFVPVKLLLLGCFCPYAGGTLLTLSGFGFNEHSKVLVGNENCNVIDGDLNKITCRTPKVRHLTLFIYLKSELRKHLSGGLNKLPYLPRKCRVSVKLCNNYFFNIFLLITTYKILFHLLNT